MATSRASQLARNSAVLNSAVLPGVSEASGSGESSGLYVAHAAQEDATEDATEPPTPPMRMHRSPRPSQEKMALLRQRYGDAKIQPREGLVIAHTRFAAPAAWVRVRAAFDVW